MKSCKKIGPSRSFTGAKIYLFGLALTIIVVLFGINFEQFELNEFSSIQKPATCTKEHVEVFSQYLKSTISTPRGVDRNWLQHFYQTNRQNQFTAIVLGCNKGIEAIQLLNLANGYEVVNLDTWVSVLNHGSTNSTPNLHKKSLQIDKLRKNQKIQSLPTEIHCVEHFPNAANVIQNAADLQGFGKTSQNSFRLLVDPFVIGSDDGKVDLPIDSETGSESLGYDLCQCTTQQHNCQSVQMYMLDNYAKLHLTSTPNVEDLPLKTIHALRINTLYSDLVRILRGGTNLLARTQYLELVLDSKNVSLIIELMQNEFGFNCFVTLNDEKLFGLNGEDACPTLLNDDFLGGGVVQLACANAELEPSLLATMQDYFQMTINSALSSKPKQNFIIPQTTDIVPVKVMEQVRQELEETFHLRTQLPQHIKEDIENCPATAQVELDANTELEYWTLHSRDYLGEIKNVGGDEYYVAFWCETNDSDSPNAVGHLNDNLDGSYSIRFYESTASVMAKTDVKGPWSDYLSSHFNTSIIRPPKYGRLEIRLLYTCGLGASYPPLKKDWKSGGAINVVFKVNVTAPDIHALPKLHPRQDLKKYDHVCAVGDSLMIQFIGAGRQISNQITNLLPKHNPLAPLNSITLNSTFMPHVQKEIAESFLLAERNLGSNLSKRIHDASTKPKLALIIGSSTWDILDVDTYFQGPFYLDHAATVERLILNVRKDYPDVDIFWKGATAMHMQNVARTVDSNGTHHELERTLYMSNSRVKQVHEQQMAVLEAYQIPILDMYNLTYGASEFTRPGDGRHYLPHFNSFLWSYFFM